MSVIFARAAAEWHRCRDEYEVYREAQYDRAVQECNGVLLNARGEAAGVSSFSLFMGPRARAEAYASEELLAFWQRYPRCTFEEFEAVWTP